MAAGLLTLSVVPAQAQMLVNDPTGNATLLNLLRTQVQDGQGLSSRAIKEMASEKHLLDQVTQMNLDHIDISSILKQLGPQLTASIQTNNDIMTKTSANDTAVNTEFKRLVPNFSGDNYLKYINQLANNSFQAYGQALGVANASVKDSTNIAAKIQELDNATPVNQLQALNQMVTIGKMQVQQTDKLIKIQSSMMKAMLVSYQKQTGMSDNGLQSFNTGLMTDHSVREYCLASVPYFVKLSEVNQTQALSDCKTRMTASRAITQ